MTHRSARRRRHARWLGRLGRRTAATARLVALAALCACVGPTPVSAQDADATLDGADAAPGDATIGEPGPLAIERVDPAEAPARTQARLTVFGSGFSAGVSQVLIGNLDTTDLYVPDDGQLLCTTTLMPADTYDVTVVMEDGREVSLMAALRFVDEMPFPGPVVLDLEPSVLAAGESFVITGVAFDEGASVRFDGPAAPEPVTVTRLDTSQLEVALPRSFPTGTWTVRVVNPDGQSAASQGVLSVTPAPPLDDGCACAVAAAPRAPTPVALLILVVLGGLCAARRATANTGTGTDT